MPSHRVRTGGEHRIPGAVGEADPEAAAASGEGTTGRQRPRARAPRRQQPRATAFPRGRTPPVMAVSPQPTSLATGLRGAVWSGGGQGGEQRGRCRDRPVRRPGRVHPGDPGPQRRGRRDRHRPRARRPQVHGVPAGRRPRAARPGRAGRRPRQVPPRHRHPPPRRRHHLAPRPGAGEPRRRPPAGPAHRGDRQRRGPLRRRRPLHGPGRRLLRPPAAQLGRPAHPAARDLQRQGPAQRAGAGRGTPPGPAPALLHRQHDHHASTT